MKKASDVKVKKRYAVPIIAGLIVEVVAVLITLWSAKIPYGGDYAWWWNDIRMPTFYFFFLAIILYLIGRAIGKSPNKGDLGIIFQMMTIGIFCVWFAMNFMGLAVFVPQGHAPLLDWYPDWMVIKNVEAIGLYWTGAGGPLPSEFWAPYGYWATSMVCVLISWVFFSLLYRKRWIDEQKLPFPMVTPVLEVAETYEAKERPSFFKNIFLWIGVLAGIIVILPSTLVTAQILPSDFANPFTTGLYFDFTPQVHAPLAFDMNLASPYVLYLFFPVNILLSFAVGRLIFDTLLIFVAIRLGLIADNTGGGAGATFFTEGLEWNAPVGRLVIGEGLLWGLLVGMLIADRKYIKSLIMQIVKGPSAGGFEKEPVSIRSSFTLFLLFNLAFLGFLLMLPVNPIVPLIIWAGFNVKYIALMRFRGEGWASNEFWPCLFQESYGAIAQRGFWTPNTQEYTVAVSAWGYYLESGTWSPHWPSGRIAESWKITDSLGSDRKTMLLANLIAIVIGAYLSYNLWVQWNYWGLGGHSGLTFYATWPIDLASGDIRWDSFPGPYWAWPQFFTGIIVSVVVYILNVTYAWFPISPIGFIAGGAAGHFGGFNGAHLGTVLVFFIIKYTIIKVGGYEANRKFLIALTGYIIGFMLLQFVNKAILFAQQGTPGVWDNW